MCGRPTASWRHSIILLLSLVARSQSGSGSLDRGACVNLCSCLGTVENWAPGALPLKLYWLYVYVFMQKRGGVVLGYCGHSRAGSSYTQGVGASCWGLLVTEDVLDIRPCPGFLPWEKPPMVVVAVQGAP
ncbi:hypothetical protein EDB85DRAFT_2003374, partial [Lactarius pseudohatsudake]